MVNFKQGPVQRVTEQEFKSLWLKMWRDYPGLKKLTKMHKMRFETYYAVRMQVLDDNTIQLTDTSYQH